MTMKKDPPNGFFIDADLYKEDLDEICGILEFNKYDLEYSLFLLAEAQLTLLGKQTTVQKMLQEGEDLGDSNVSEEQLTQFYQHTYGSKDELN